MSPCVVTCRIQYAPVHKSETLQISSGGVLLKNTTVLTSLGEPIALHVHPKSTVVSASTYLTNTTVFKIPMITVNLADSIGSAFPKTALPLSKYKLGFDVRISLQKASMGGIVGKTRYRLDYCNPVLSLNISIPSSNIHNKVLVIEDLSKTYDNTTFVVSVKSSICYWDVVPTVTRVSGCSRCQPSTSTCKCPTDGSTVLTIVGAKFGT